MARRSESGSASGSPGAEAGDERSGGSLLLWVWDGDGTRTGLGHSEGEESGRRESGRGRLVRLNPGGGPVEEVAEGGHRGVFESRGVSIMIGRALDCTLVLVDSRASRRHASLTWRGGRWFITDEGSSAGTLLNGVRLESGRPQEILPGDHLLLGASVLRVGGLGSTTSTYGGVHSGTRSPARTIDDGRYDRVLDSDEHAAGAGESGDRLMDVFESSLEALRVAGDESDVLHRSSELAVNIAGFPRAVVLRVEPVVVADCDAQDAKGEFEATIEASAGGVVEAFSRSLVQAAMQGRAAVLGRSSMATGGASIAELSIRSAVCVPIIAGSLVLYADARGGERAGVSAGAGGGDGRDGLMSEGAVRAIAAAASQAIGERRRAELERRRAELEGELGAARAVQRAMLPALAGRVGGLEYAVRLDPGRFVSGDLFDAIDLGGGRSAVAIGDVTGHGVGPGLVMALVIARLGAFLVQEPDAGAAVTALNQYLCERLEHGRFVSLLVVVRERDGSVCAVDAGHGYAAVVGRGGVVGAQGLGMKGGPPLGVVDSMRYSAEPIEIDEGDALVLWTDGIIERRETGGEMFGGVRLFDAIGVEAPGEPGGVIARLFEELDGFAVGGEGDDDATAACVRLV